PPSRAWPRAAESDRGSVSLLRKPFPRQLGHQPQRALVVELPEHLVGKVHAVELPERMVVAIVVEVLVRRLEHAPVVGILDGLEAVLAEEDPVLVSDEEVPGRAGLAPELVQ